ncbi:MAG TPA: hypothetical protein VFT74_17370, partial [Isosphaeraceae bacterium]|nr:hypothetical protein [Isosphaeraceae bacterium]
SGRLDTMPTVVVKDSLTKTVSIQAFQTAIPPRMLFQIPDFDLHPTAASANTGQFLDSPATETGLMSSPADHFIPGATPTYPLTNLYADLFHDLGPTAANPALPPYQLGSASPLAAAADPANADFDRRQHPYFRTELMQKMMNLSTVRTHQFACWITVGFFEVAEEGNPQILATASGRLSPFNVVDQLGKELGAAEGKSTRYKLFCVIDRSRADAYNPAEPEDFNNYIVYSNRIE